MNSLLWIFGAGLVLTAFNRTRTAGILIAGLSGFAIMAVIAVVIGYLLAPL